MAKQVSPTQKMLFAWGWILIAWSVYRFVFKMELGIWIDEFVAKPLVFILPVYFYIRKYEKKPFFQAVALERKNLKHDLLLGGVIGLIFFGILFATSDQGKLLAIISRLFTTQNIYLIVLTAFITSFSEELLARGFVLKRLYDESKNLFTSAFFASILYFFIRVPVLFSNSELVGTALLNIMMTDLIFSFAVSVVFILRRSLILPIIIHALYILNIYLLLGFS